MCEGEGRITSTGRTRRAKQLIWLTLAFASPAAADRHEGMRPWTIDGTIGPRFGQAGGQNLRLSAAWVPWRNLTPARNDRAWYASVGALGAIGGLYHRTVTGETREKTTTLAPEIRTGIALYDDNDDHDNDQFLFYLYLSASVGWLRSSADEGNRVDRVDHHLTTRLAAGVSIPVLRRAALEMITKGPDDDDNYDDNVLTLQPFQYLGHIAAGLFWLLAPNTIEITWERANGLEYTGVAFGYAL
ncbi:MAG: hypothetical protein R3B06_11910 [Kofleriaceae bacterium]